MGQPHVVGFSTLLLQPKFVWLSCRHRAAIAGHLQRLDHGDRVRRFGRPRSDSDIIVFAAALDPKCDWMLGAFALDDCLVGLAHATPSAKGGGCVVDAALSVDKGWRGHGLGRALLGAIVGRVHGSASTSVVALVSSSQPQRHNLRDELEPGVAAQPHEVCAGIRIEAEPAPQPLFRRAR
jgi:GNAT superfamily N-acetyltransferase